jgi:parallel beta-helix repeat protein
MRASTSFLIGTLALTPGVGCGDDGDTGGAAAGCDTFASANCVEIPGGDSAALLEAVNALADDTTVLLGAGTYELDNQVTIRADGIKLAGRGIDRTTLSFGTTTTQANGIDAVGDDFLVQDLTVLDAPKDAIRVENSDGVVYRRVKTTWTNPADSSNGAYGIYPVRCRNVLIEDSVAEHASDAGLYVGQSINVIVRDNRVEGNVAGLEIENTQFADVYDNVATGNTAGIVVFDLPGNPVVGRDVRMRDNQIFDNNLDNFAPGGIVSEIPAGTGTFAFASRRVEIRDNDYQNNDTVDIAILNGQIVEGADAWVLDTGALIGDWEDLGLLAGPEEGTVTNFRSENIVIAGNTHDGSGSSVDVSKELGLLVGFLYTVGDNTRGQVPSIIYDAIGESAFDADDPAANSNDNHICAGGNPNANAFGSMDALTQVGANLMAPHLIIEDPPFAPFDCDVLEGGPIPEVSLQ